MNSSQRRTINRKHPYHISMIGKRNYEFYDSVDAAEKWCKKKCAGGFYSTACTDGVLFRFAREKDAVFFALKFL